MSAVATPPLFHCHISAVTRAEGHSAVAALAYDMRARVVDERVGIEYDYRLCHLHERLVANLDPALPAGAPPEWADPAVLWNAAEKAEHGSIGRVATRIEFSLPDSLTTEQQIELVKTVMRGYATHGYAVSASIHAALVGSNPHAHLIVSNRAVAEDGSGFVKQKCKNIYVVKNVATGDVRECDAEEFKALKEDGCEKVYRYLQDGKVVGGTQSEAAAAGLHPTKDRVTKSGRKGKSAKAPVQRTQYIDIEPVDPAKVEMWRSRITALTNRALRAYGHADKLVDHRSYKRQGVDLESTTHEGPVVHAMEARAEAKAAAEGREYTPVTVVRAENMAILADRAADEPARQRLITLQEELNEVDGELRERVDMLTHKVDGFIGQVERLRASEKRFKNDVRLVVGTHMVSTHARPRRAALGKAWKVKPDAVRALRELYGADAVGEEIAKKMSVSVADLRRMRTFADAIWQTDPMNRAASEYEAQTAYANKPEERKKWGMPPAPFIGGRVIPPIPGDALAVLPKSWQERATAEHQELVHMADHRGIGRPDCDGPSAGGRSHSRSR